MNTLAFDLGASGGKLIAGNFNGRILRIHEVHRFSNQPVEHDGSLTWDIHGIYANLREGLSKASARNCASLGIDAFCNDYGLLDIHGNLISNVTMYRDRRTEGIQELIDQKIDPRDLYHRTGCQRARFNTLIQLVAHIQSVVAPQIQKADKLLFVPDLLNYWLSGVPATEFTISSVSQLFNREGDCWDAEILDTFNLPLQIFPTVLPTAQKLGEVKNTILEASGIKALTIYTVGHHDTASAVAAVPCGEEPFAYISSGTWSLIGTETKQMITSDLAFQENFANEGGVGKTNRLSKNVMGLWLVQELQRVFAAQGQPQSFEDIERKASNSPSFAAVFDPDDPRFFCPGDVIEKIKEICQESHQPMPETIGAMTRSIYESLALAYRYTLEKMEQVAGHRYSHIHVIGGGAKSALLNQLTASALKIPVVAGPTEATAIGNLCTQYMAMGELQSLIDIRELVKASFQFQESFPQDGGAWDAAYENFLKVKSNQ